MGHTRAALRHARTGRRQLRIRRSTPMSTCGTREIG